MDGFSSGMIPYYHCFTLICNPDGLTILAIQFSFLERLAYQLLHAGPDFLCIVLYPARFGEVLREFLVGTGNYISRGIEAEHSGASSALIYGHYKITHGHKDSSRAVRIASRNEAQ